MLKKILLNIFYILILFLVAILQLSIFSAWDGFFASFNIILLFLVFVLFFYDLKSAIITALIFSFCLELYSFDFFGIHALSIFASLYLIERISVSWLTNRSLYSFILINIFAILPYQLLSAIFLYFSDISASSFIVFSASFWFKIFYQIIWAIIVSLISFNIMISFNDKFKPDFLGGKMRSN